MASHPRTSAREERRLNIRTLVIASIASASAAVIVSQVWIAGTWVAAALTPVIVALVSEALHRPAAVIADRFTGERDAVLPEGAGAGAPPTARRRERPAPADPGSTSGGAEPPLRVYRAGGGAKPVRPPASRRKIAIGVVAVTALLAFAIAAFAITGTELVTGGSIGKGDRHTTLFGGKKQGSQDEGTTSGQEQSAPPGGAEHQGREQENQQQDQQQPQAEPQSTTPSTPKTTPQTTTP